MKDTLEIIRALVRPTATWFVLLLAGGMAAYLIVADGPLAERAFALVSDAMLVVIGFWFGSRQKT